MKSNSAFVFAMVILIFAASGVRAEDRALVVGVDVYLDKNIRPTDGCTNDARAMRQLLIEKFGFAPNSVKMLLDENASASNIVQTFQTWLIDGTKPGDRVFFFYAGHGFQTPDDDGDEADKQDEVITPFDVSIKSVNGKITLTNEKTFIRDDKFNDFIAGLSGRRAVLTFDSCHSGTFSRGLTDSAKALGSRYLRTNKTRSITDNADNNDSTVPKNGEPRDLKVVTETKLDGSINGVALFSAASPYQEAFPVAVNGKIRGAFSYLFENLIRQNDGESLDGLDRNLKIEMKKFADKGQIGKGSNNEFQIPQLEIVSKTKLNDKPLFAETSKENGYTAAAEYALFNPISTMRVKLSIGKNKYKIGETISYKVETEQSAYLYILVFSNENKAFCIFPSAVATDKTNFLQKGKYEFPREDYATQATPPAGFDVWVALVSKKKLNLGEKQDYTWDEVFKRINLEELRKAIIGKTRGAGNVKTVSAPAADWQASTVVIETLLK
ncbi:MAG: caspase family protein [Pyrinomonadaceae bacterium]|nr:caspase family protein [Pyrinomonadaceae bacterium]